MDDHLVTSSQGVRQLYGEPGMHCAKAILRSRLWSPEERPSWDALPLGVEIMADHTGVGNRASWETAIADSYANRL